VLQKFPEIFKNFGFDGLQYRNKCLYYMGWLFKRGKANGKTGSEKPDEDCAGRPAKQFTETLKRYTLAPQQRH